MLTEIRLRNFKCFESLDLQPGLITVLIGPNGTGKSSVLQSLMLLRQSAGAGSLKFQGAFVNLAGFVETIHNRSKSKIMTLGLSGGDRLESDSIRFTYDVAIRNAADATRGDIVTSEGSIQWGSVNFKSRWPGDGTDNQLSPQRVGDVEFRVKPSNTIGSFVSLQPASVALNPENQRVIQIISEIEGVVRHEFESWRFVPAERGFLDAVFELSESSTPEIHSASDIKMVARGIASSLTYESDEIENRISKWIERITGSTISHRVVEGPLVTIRSKSPDSQANTIIINEGFGTNQLIFVMFALARLQDGGLVAVEEPETHLHPRAIARLGDVFAEIAKCQRSQLLLTTHSEHLLMSLLNNVAEKKLEADQLAIYYFERQDGQPTATRLKVTPEGMVHGGLPGFFDASLEAQRRHLDALARAS